MRVEHIPKVGWIDLDHIQHVSEISPTGYSGGFARFCHLYFEIQLMFQEKPIRVAIDAECAIEDWETSPLFNKLLGIQELLISKWKGDQPQS